MGLVNWQGSGSEGMKLRSCCSLAVALTCTPVLPRPCPPACRAAQLLRIVCSLADLGSRPDTVWLLRFVEVARSPAVSHGLDEAGIGQLLWAFDRLSDSTLPPAAFLPPDVAARVQASKVASAAAAAAGGSGASAKAAAKPVASARAERVGRSAKGSRVGTRAKRTRLGV